jgi:hypothetical protein
MTPRSMIQWYCLDNRNRSANVFFYCTSAPAMRAPTAYPLEAVTPLAQEDTSSSVGCLGNIRREQEAFLHFIPRSVPMNDQSFIAELKDLLQRNPPLNKVDRDIAIDMIKAALNRSTLWASGPCIQCLAPIEYGPPSKSHRRPRPTRAIRDNPLRLAHASLEIRSVPGAKSLVLAPNESKSAATGCSTSISILSLASRQ